MMASQRQSFAFRILEKAQELIRFKEVHKIDEDTYLAKQHGEPTVPDGYMVKRNSSGIWTCVCKGYKRRHICSHAIAVLMLESGKSEEIEN